MPDVRHRVDHRRYWSKIKKDSPRAIDLYSGAGGFSLGIMMAGFRVLLGVEQWAAAADTYEFNLHVPVWRVDITKVTGSQIRQRAGLGPAEDLDLVVGGPPCQSFSTCGRRAAGDPRDHHVLHFIQLVGEIFPKMFVMENVPGILSKDGGVWHRRILELADALGYKVKWQKLDAADYGVPQHRVRVFYIGMRKGFMKEVHAFDAESSDPKAMAEILELQGDPNVQWRLVQVDLDPQIEDYG
jgi:DNA (cytosine-5)-methyltransferase 1